jgi:hypothetical protein
MELAKATTSAARHHNFGSATATDAIIEQRLAELLKINAEIAAEKKTFGEARDRIEISMMSCPIDSKKAYAYFGFMIGLMPPYALILKIVSETMPGSRVPFLFLALLAVAGTATGIVGYATGRIVPAAMKSVSDLAWPNRIAFLSLIGLGWGAISGIVGGLFLFVIGAVFAGIAGGIIGAVCLPVLAGLHSLLRSGDFIELKHFLPIAFAITLSLCAFILGA